jgi:hypothetical protein
VRIISLRLRLPLGKEKLWGSIALACGLYDKKKTEKKQFDSAFELELVPAPFFGVSTAISSLFILSILFSI